MPKVHSLEARLRKVPLRAVTERLKVALEFGNEVALDDIRAYLQSITRCFLDAKETLSRQGTQIDIIEKKLVSDKPQIFNYHDAQARITLGCAMNYIQICSFPCFRGKYARKLKSISRGTGLRASKNKNIIVSSDRPIRKPSPPQMFASNLNDPGASKDSDRKSSRSQFKKPPASQHLHLSPSTQENHRITIFEREVRQPSAITAGFRCPRPSFASTRFTESESAARNHPREVPLDDTSEVREEERTRRARERASAWRRNVADTESNNPASTRYNIPTPPSSQPDMYAATNRNPRQSSITFRTEPHEKLPRTSVDQLDPTARAALRAQVTFSFTAASSSSSSRDAAANPSDFMGRFLAGSLPPLTHLRPALAHARLTEARIRGMGARWVAPDIEEFLRKKLGNLRDANDDLVNDVDLTFLARHYVYCFGEGSGSRGDEI